MMLKGVKCGGNGTAKQVRFWLGIAAELFPLPPLLNLPQMNTRLISDLWDYFCETQAVFSASTEVLVTSNSLA